MKRCLIIALLFFGHDACCKDYLDYYRTIARAETAAVNAAYKEALSSYDSAFEAFDYNNPIDLYVAAQLASFMGRQSQAAHYILKGISLGLPLQTVWTNRHLQSTIAAGVALDEVMDSCRRRYESGINKAARARLITLAHHDQSLIHSIAGGIYDKSNGLKTEYIPVWDSMLQELIYITKTWGFPAQKITGTQSGDDNFFLVSPQNTYAYFMLVHHSNAWLALKGLLPAELRKGNITPQMYGSIADGSNGHSDYGRMTYMAVRPCEATVHPKRCRVAIAGRMDQINQARDEIGLCSYEVAALKLRSSVDYVSWMKSGAKESKPVFDFKQSFNQW